MSSEQKVEKGESAENDENERETTSIIELISDSIILKIFHQLEDLDEASRVSRRWNRISKDWSLHKCVDFHEVCLILSEEIFASEPSLLKRLRPTPGRVKSLSFQDCASIKSTDANKCLLLVPNVVFLDFSNCFNLGPFLFRNFAPNLSLRVVRFNNISSTVNLIIPNLVA